VLPFGPVGRIVGREVRSFLSAVDTEAGGLVTEIFVLHPRRGRRTVADRPRRVVLRNGKIRVGEVVRSRIAR
jgi:hypothetical protein